MKLKHIPLRVDDIVYMSDSESEIVIDDFNINMPDFSVEDRIGRIGITHIYNGTNLTRKYDYTRIVSKPDDKIIGILDVDYEYVK